MTVQTNPTREDIWGGAGAAVALIGLALIFSWDLWHPGPNQVALRSSWQAPFTGSPGHEWVVPMLAWIALSITFYGYLLLSDVRPAHAAIGAFALQYHPLTLSTLSTESETFLTFLFAVLILFVTILRSRALGWTLMAALTLMFGGAVSWRLVVCGLLFALSARFGQWAASKRSISHILLGLIILSLLTVANKWIAVSASHSSFIDRLTNLYPGSIVLVLFVAGQRDAGVALPALVSLSSIGYAWLQGQLLGMLAVLLFAVGTGQALERWSKASLLAPRCKRLTQGLGAVILFVLLVYPSVRTGRISGGREMFDPQPYTLPLFEHGFYVLVSMGLSALVVLWWAKNQRDVIARGAVAALLLLDLWSVAHNYYQPFLPISPASLTKERIVKQERFDFGPSGPLASERK